MGYNVSIHCPRPSTKEGYWYISFMRTILKFPNRKKKTKTPSNPTNSKISQEPLFKFDKPHHSNKSDVEIHNPTVPHIPTTKQRRDRFHNVSSLYMPPWPPIFGLDKSPNRSSKLYVHPIAPSPAKIPWLGQPVPLKLCNVSAAAASKVWVVE